MTTDDVPKLLLDLDEAGQTICAGLQGLLALERWQVTAVSESTVRAPPQGACGHIRIGQGGRDG